MNSTNETSGWFLGIGAFIWWGLVPIYFKALQHVEADEILAHRIAWCVPVTLLLMLVLGKKVELVKIFKNKRLILGLITSTLLVSSNWYIFTWAVTHNQILDTSLGYFINPIMSILLGVIFLAEKLSRLQWAAVIAVVAGVANQIINYGEIPWIALSLATTFALYGFIRKQLQVDALNGLLVETVLAFPLAAGFILYSLSMSHAQFLSANGTTDWLLVCGGIITAVPLIWFAAAAKRIPLNSVGFLQFIAPSLTFILATQYYGEPLGIKQLLSFIFIWIGLILYLINPIRKRMAQRRANPSNVKPL
ncbi:EamA family transporter RarD [Aliikangiella maris]|uniref:EamA family transporter RarD n=2 Tax=Aliikangiella maris TaxID=3162458 RepID=A0ABV3MRX9_9GAMM